VPITAQQLEALVKNGATDEEIKQIISQSQSVSAPSQPWPTGPQGTTDEEGQPTSFLSRIVQGITHPSPEMRLGMDALPLGIAATSAALPRVPAAVEGVGGAMQSTGNFLKPWSKFGLYEAAFRGDPKGAAAAVAPYAVDAAGKGVSALGRAMGNLKPLEFDLGGEKSPTIEPNTAPTPPTHFEPPPAPPIRPVSSHTPVMSPTEARPAGPEHLDINALPLSQQMEHLPQTGPSPIRRGGMTPPTQSSINDLPLAQQMEHLPASGPSPMRRGGMTAPTPTSINDRPLFEQIESLMAASHDQPLGVGRASSPPLVQQGINDLPLAKQMEHLPLQSGGPVQSYTHQPGPPEPPYDFWAGAKQETVPPPRPVAAPTPRPPIGIPQEPIQPAVSHVPSVPVEAPPRSLTPQAAFTPSRSSNTDRSLLPGGGGLSTRDESALRQAMGFKPDIKVTGLKPTVEGDAIVKAARASRQGLYKAEGEQNRLYQNFIDSMKP
jgi:hypothetical protein